jgi:hypothetical protein
LLIAWSFFHKLYEPDSLLSRNFLVIAPNIIVLDRLRTDFDGLKIFFNDPVLPNNGYEGRNWRDDFQITLHIQDEVRIVRETGNFFLTNIHRVFLGDVRDPSLEDDTQRETVSVVGTPAFMDFVESIQSEGVTFERVPMGQGTTRHESLIVEVDAQNPDKDLDKLDIPLPKLTRRFNRDFKGLDALDPAAFGNQLLPLKPFTPEENPSAPSRSSTSGATSARRISTSPGGSPAKRRSRRSPARNRSSAI